MSDRASTHGVERASGQPAARRRRRHDSLFVIALVAGVFLATGAAVWWLGNMASAPWTGPASGVGPSQLSPAGDDRRQGTAPREGIRFAADTEQVPQIPTSGENISLEFIPIVPQLLVHLRPGKIWNRSIDSRELLGTLGNLGIWLREFIIALTRFHPEEIDELTIAVNFGVRASVPDIAAVVRLKEEVRKSELLRTRFHGWVVPKLVPEVIESDDSAAVLIDRRTIAVTSTGLTKDLADSLEYPAVPPVELERLLKSSDRDRHFSLLFDLQILDVHRENVFIDQLQQLAERFVLWFGGECRAVSWSVHLEPHLFMDTRITPAAEISPLRLQRHLSVRLDDLPLQLMEFVRTMNPPARGRRRIIGRFPAMMQALVLGTSTVRTREGIRLMTVLPAKATANLAAGATLTWNESVAPGTHRSLVTDKPRPVSVSERLQRPVLVDFRRDPLYEVFVEIGRATDVRVRIDADALKLAGFTQNMPQTHSLGNLPALEALDAILGQYEGRMVVVVNEPEGLILLTTRDFAESHGLSILDTSR